MHAEHDDGGAGNRLADLACGFDAIEIRHAYIEDHDFGTLLAGQVHGLAPVGRLRDHAEFGMLLQHTTKARPHKGVVISDQDASQAHSGLSHRRLRQRQQ